MSKRKAANEDKVKKEESKPFLQVVKTEGEWLAYASVACLTWSFTGTPRKRQKTATTSSPPKRVKRSRSSSSADELVEVDDAFPDWPAPRDAMEKAREFILEM